MVLLHVRQNLQDEPISLSYHILGVGDYSLEGTVEPTKKFDFEQALTSTITATITSTIQANNHASVYRAVLNTGGDSDPINVVLKFVLRSGEAREDLQFEAAVYAGILKSAQGKEVPIFYGLYERSTKSSYMGCMVLEDCGDNLIDSFEKLTQTDKIDILKKLTTIHFLGCLPMDLAARNIVCRRVDEAPAEYRLIDFHWLMDYGVPHKCKWNKESSNWNNWTSVQPLGPEHIGCFYLYGTADEVMEFWDDTLPIYDSETHSSDEENT